MISSPGVGSGLDVNSIVQQLMAIERQPLNRLNADRQGLEAKLSAFGRLKGALSTFQGALSDLKTVNAFSVYKAVSGDEKAFTAAADSTAAPGSLNVQVINLAEAHKMGSQVFADTDTTTIGVPGDQLTLTINSKSFTVNAGGMTLTQLQDAINQATDNTGVSASIVSEDATNNYLVLTANDTGVANAVTLSSTGSIASQLGFTDINIAEDAQLLVDGTYNVTRASNIISDAVSGVTLTLNQETGSAVSLNIQRDLDAVTDSVQTFVDTFNELRTTMGELRGNELEADSTLSSIESQLRGVLNTPPGAALSLSYSYLSEIGVSLQKDGSMSLDSAQLKNIISSDFTEVAQLFANNPEGYLFRLDAMVNNIVNPQGIIDGRESGINDRMTTVDKRISDMEFRLQLTESRLLGQFNALDALMGQLQGTSSFLTQQLQALPKIGG